VAPDTIDNKGYPCRVRTVFSMVFVRVHYSTTKCRCAVGIVDLSCAFTALNAVRISTAIGCALRKYAGDLLRCSRS
jgi:hypothetical protein